MSEESPDLSFEEALDQLESVVKDMESGNLPLASLVEKFAEGNNLTKICEKRLQEAEMKIQELKQTSEEMTLKAFDPTGDQI